jgi:uracil-DNA glycosylase
MTARNRLTTPLDTHIQKLSQAWREILADPGAQDGLNRVKPFLDGRLRAGAEIYPHQPFRALELVEPTDIRVVILGQDPYHGPNQAQGLAFSVPDTCPSPPSLRNIFQELSLEYPQVAKSHGHELSRWARQGVLLLNTILTVEARTPGSHTRQGWEAVTDAIIAHVARTPQPKVFMLWGAHAQAKQALLDGQDPKAGALAVLTANHPSPLSARRPPKPFIGCNHFILANAWLRKQGQATIEWV